MCQDLHVNEIRDYINRAPPRNKFVDGRIVWYTAARLKWLYEIAHGSIDDRINRRAGVVDLYEPWKPSPVYRACQRHRVNEWRKAGVRVVNRRL